jgi:hypothetical protein
LLILKDALNGMIVLSFFFILSHLIPSTKALSVFFRIFYRLVLFFALVITFMGFLDLFGILPYERYFLVEIAENTPFPYDNNFGLLPVLFGIVILLYYILYRNPKYYMSIISGLLSGMFSLFVLLSGSKRGLFILILITAFVVIGLLVSFFRRNLLNTGMRLGLGTMILVLVILFSGFYFFCFNITFSAKNEFLKTIGTKDLENTKEKLSNNTYKFYSLIAQNNSLREFHETLWSIRFDSKDPDLGWVGTTGHGTVFPLAGTNVEIVPRDAKGILINGLGKYDSWDGDAYSITPLGRIDVNDNQKAEASIFCYVSDDFNGDWAKLILLYTKTGEIHSEYDLQRKGTWQKLSVSDDCLSAMAELRFYLFKHGVTDFASLRGYVIIAYPQFTVINPDGKYKSLYGIATENLVPGKVIKSGFFDFSFKTNTDPVRNWVRRFVAEDTTYYGYKSKIEIKSSEGSFLKDDRSAHWEFAVKIFKDEYSLRQKFIGKGFDHLNWFGYYFLGDKTRSDWPHNPFLSVLLYSGLLGLSLYFFFLYKVIYYYLKYIKEYPLTIIFFIICFFFSFFSGGSPFDPPVIGFFVMLPFLIHSVHRKNNLISE